MQPGLEEGAVQQDENNAALNNIEVVEDEEEAEEEEEEERRRRGVRGRGGSVSRIVLGALFFPSNVHIISFPCTPNSHQKKTLYCI
jgi:hypothetical protein